MRVQPDSRVTENHIAGGVPSGVDLAAAFHSGANCAIPSGDYYPRKKNSGLALNHADGTDHSNVARESSGGIAVQLYRAACPHTKQAGIGVIDGHVNHDL